MDEYTNIEQAYDADQLEERIRRLRSRVVSLVRYGVAKAGRDFLNRASAPEILSSSPWVLGTHTRPSLRKLSLISVSLDW